jgi:hypothetical protein
MADFPPGRIGAAAFEESAPSQLQAYVIRGND